MRTVVMPATHAVAVISERRASSVATISGTGIAMLASASGSRSRHRPAIAIAFRTLGRWRAPCPPCAAAPRCPDRFRQDGWRAPGSTGQWSARRPSHGGGGVPEGPALPQRLPRLVRPGSGSPHSSFHSRYRSAVSTMWRGSRVPSLRSGPVRNALSTNAACATGTRPRSAVASGGRAPGVAGASARSASRMPWITTVSAGTLRAGLTRP